MYLNIIRVWNSNEYLFKLNKRTYCVKFIFTKVCFQTLLHWTNNNVGAFKSQIIPEFKRNVSFFSTKKVNHFIRASEPILLSVYVSMSQLPLRKVMSRHVSFYGIETREICVPEISFSISGRRMTMNTLHFRQKSLRSTVRVYGKHAKTAKCLKEKRTSLLKPLWRNNFSVFCRNRICVIY